MLSCPLSVSVRLFRRFLIRDGEEEKVLVERGIRMST